VNVITGLLDSLVQNASATKSASKASASVKLMIRITGI